MNSTDDSKKSKPEYTGLIITLLVGVVVSFIWLYALHQMTIRTLPCPQSWWEIWKVSNDTLQGRLSCRTPNELGDFLAGAFAPLAFFWFVLAVLLQTFELKAQREELHSANQAAYQQAGWARQNTQILSNEQELKVLAAHIDAVAHRIVATPYFAQFETDVLKTGDFWSLIDITKLGEWKTSEELIYRTYFRLSRNWMERRDSMIEAEAYLDSLVDFLVVYKATKVACEYGKSLEGVAASKFTASGLPELWGILKKIKASSMYRRNPHVPDLADPSEQSV